MGGFPLSPPCVLLSGGLGVTADCATVSVVFIRSLVSSGVVHSVALAVDLVLLFMLTATGEHPCVHIASCVPLCAFERGHPVGVPRVYPKESSQRLCEALRGIS